MKITFDEWGCCTSETCKFWKSCAQNYTAGDFRTEGGFRPWIRGDECVTADEPVATDGSYYRPEPANYNQLERGFIPKKELPKQESFDPIGMP